MDIEKEYLRIRNEMVDRIAIYEQDMRDALGMCDVAFDYNDITKETRTKIIKDIVRDMADMLIAIGTDALMAIIDAERKSK